MSDATFNVDEYLNRELLRFTTAGSVDDGKSTLIGRMLYDSKAIFQDQMEALEKTSELRGEKDVNLALLTDGLRAEREQGITIDVAYRYFSTPKRKFIIADTPGHEQYTRNMVTGASTADLAVILIDARNGVLTQSRRHGFIASLLGIPHIVVAVNKMDAVEYRQDIYDNIVKDYRTFCEKLDIHDIIFIPISALKGDNVVDASDNMSWFDGPTVLHHLETVAISADRNLVDFRFPVQYVVRPDQDFRGFAGRISSGTISPGEEIIALPSGHGSRVKEVYYGEETVSEAFEKQSIVLTLEDEIDISRGEMIVRKNNVPTVGTVFESYVCWMDERLPLETNKPYLLQQTTRVVQCYIRDLRYRIDVNTLHREDAPVLELNEIGRAEIETAQALFYDPYKKNRETGSFILIDPATNITVGAGMIRGGIQDAERVRRHIDIYKKSPDITWDQGSVSFKERIERNGHEPRCIWLTGLSGSGKSTIAREAEKRLFDEGKQVFVLDGDNVRHGLCGDLGFSNEDRNENIRRIAHVARLMYEAGYVVLCTFVSPDRELRQFARSLFPEGGFQEVFVKCSVEECRKRDVKGLYAKADAGEIHNFTGISSKYEEPENAELLLDTDTEELDESVEKLIKLING